MDMPLLSIGPVHFSFKGYWVVFFIFIQILIEHYVSKQGRPRSDAVASDLGLNCLSMPHGKASRLIRVKHFSKTFLYLKASLYLLGQSGLKRVMWAIMYITSLHCLSIPHKKPSRLIWVKYIFYKNIFGLGSQFILHGSIRTQKGNVGKYVYNILDDDCKSRLIQIFHFHKFRFHLWKLSFCI